MAFTKMLKNFESSRLLEIGFWRFLPVFALLVTITDGLNSEGQLLLELKNGFRDEYNYLWNWKSTDETPCGWTGVSCSSYYEPVVWSVDLSKMNLSGTVDPSIGGLTHLKFLDLSYNQFSGSIPKEIGNCSFLVFLYLNNNQFNGPIPPELGRLSYLSSLNICNNKISGSFPEELGNLSSLEEFVAYTNNLTGPLPRSIGNLRKLRIFRAEQNAFSGSLPAEISGCQSLQMLGLAQNHIEGELPKELGMLGSMTDLVLWENELSGFIPKELGNCTSLETLALYSNGLVGQIPAEIGNLKFLKKLYLYRNELNGSIPREIGNLSLATEIDFSENYLTGDIPTEFGKIKGLRLLHLFENQLTGVIPNELSSLRYLTKLDLSINYLTGPIPYGFQYLTQMVQLQLFDNFLSGTIPQLLGVYSPLWVVDFSDNHLTGKIPLYLCRCANLILLNLGANNLLGDIPTGIKNCKTLVQLRLVGNRLNGSFPSELCKLVNLSAIELGQNNFTRPVPSEIGNCQKLQRLHIAELPVLLPFNKTRAPRDTLMSLDSMLILHPFKSKILKEMRFFHKSGTYLTSESVLIVPSCILILTVPIPIILLDESFPMCTTPPSTELYVENHSLLGHMWKEHPESRIHSDVSLELSLVDNNKKSSPPSSTKLAPATSSSLLSAALLFRKNQFNSDLPKEIGNLSQLVTFNVSSNLLSGKIPREIVNCKMLQRLDLSHNSFVDTLPIELGTLTQLEILKLSENKVSENIPAALGNLSRLTELQMGGNLFSGEIPQELGSLSSLQIAMNLSNNHLTGNIPPELGNLNLLEFLLLDNNNLTGNMPASSFVENEGLCGRPLQDCNGDSSSPSALHVNKDTRGRMITIISGVVGGVSIVLIIILIYQIRRPPETVAPSQEKEISSSSPVSDIYFHPKEGFTFQDLIEATNNFHESYIVGRGAFGTVYKAVMNSGQTIAVKRLASNAEGNNIENSFRAEILTLGKIRHRNIVKLYGFCYHQGSNLLLYEYMENGSLGELIHGRGSCSLEWPTRFMIALGAAEGLAYLHHDCKPKIVHRDIKSNNILLDEKFEAHVGDFGLAKVIDMPQSKSMSVVAGSYGYIAPEYAYTMKVTEKCDIYSYGVVLLELLTGKTPVQPLDQGGDLVTHVRHYVRDHSLTSGILDDSLNLNNKSIVNHMLTVLKIALLCTNLSPLDRPSMREVIVMLSESKGHDDDNSMTSSSHQSM
ncbi:hypothetical protein V6Z11_A02G037100 [Gossypium hirsutum]